MRRIRIVFLALAIGLSIPMVWLVQRALESVVFQREIQYQTVAERLFDEMERPLAEFAGREDARPVGAYRFYRSAEDAEAGEMAGERSPLSRDPQTAYVLGYFEVDANGGFHSPLVPRDAERARARGEWPPSPATLQRVARLETIARRGLGAKRQPVSEAEWIAEQRQAPGTTRKSAPEPPAKQKAAEADDEVAQRLEKSDTYRVLKNLRRAGQERARDKAMSERKGRRASPAPKRVAETSESSGFAMGDARELAAARPRADATFRRPTAARAPAPAAVGGADRSARIAAQPDADALLDVPAEAVVEGAMLEKEEASYEQRQAEAPVPAAAGKLVSIARGLASSEAVDALASTRLAEVESLRGELVDAAYLVLSRTVRMGTANVRQGVVLDVDRLATEIGHTVLRDSGLEGRSSLEFRPAQAAQGSPGDDYLYRHRFTVPFDALTASMTLPPLSDAEGPNYPYILSLLLLLAAAAGLVALYRMVAVTVAFAERRSNFVASVSHELKTPLTAIRMYGEMLRDGMVESEAKRQEYFSTITAESERLTRLINNVLEFSRLEQGTRDVHLVVGDLGPVVEEAARLLAPHVGAMGFRLAVEVEPGLPAVRFDRDALLQVVYNLVDNAVKYAREAPDKEIILQCGRRDEDVALAVRDHGPGVSARHLSKIFEPFYRGEDELTRSAKGTGIGLALVRGLADRMGAAVSGSNLSEGGFEVSVSFRAATA